MSRPGNAYIAALVTGTWLCFVAAAAHAEVTARVDRAEIGRDETIVLTVDVADPRPASFNNLVATDFQVVAQSMRSSSRRDGRSVTRTTTLTLRLRPVRTGTLSTGSVQVRLGSETVTTDPIQIEVVERSNAAPPSPVPARDPVRPHRSSPVPTPGDDGSLPPPPAPATSGMMGATPERDPGNVSLILATVSASEPTVGQPVIVDYLLFTPSMALLSDGIDMSEPEFTDAWFLDISEPRRRMYGTRRLAGQTIGGEPYDVQLLRSYAVVPLSDGELVIPPLELELMIRGGRRQSTTEEVRSRPLLLDVALPPSDPPTGFTPENVGHWELDASVDRTRARVGDSVVLTLRADGVGLASRLRLPDAPELNGARRLEPRDEAESEYGSDGWLRGETIRRVTYIPQEEGTLEIPSVSWTVFDPWAGAYRELTTRPITIEVEGTNPNWAPVDEAAAEVGAWVDDLPSLRRLNEAGAVRTPWQPGPAWAGAAAAPWLLVASVWAAEAVRRRRRETAPQRRDRSAGPQTLRRLADASDAGAVAQAIRRYLTDVGVEGAVGATAAVLRERARSALGEPGVSLVAALQQAELARFAGDGDVADLCRRAEEAVRAAEEAR